MASPTLLPHDPQRGERKAGDVARRWSSATEAAETLPTARETAADLLADAERLAANVLAEAERRARRLVANHQGPGTPEAPGAPGLQATRDSIEDLIRSRHEELLAIMTECRDHLRAALEHPRFSIDHHVAEYHTVGSLAAIDFFAAPEPPLAPAAGRTVAERADNERGVGDDVVVALANRRPAPVSPGPFPATS